MKKLILKRTCFLLTVIFLVLFAVSGCSKSHVKEQEKTQIVATLFPQYDFARTIAGKDYSVALLLPPGTDSHTYDPSGKDMQKIHFCDLLLYTGDGMEPWVKSLAEQKNSENKLFDVSKNIILGMPSKTDNHSPDGDGHNHSHSYDPHIWTSPKNALIMVDNILEALCEKYPESTNVFTQNATALKQKLFSLDKEITNIVSSSEKNTLYFGGRFAFYYFVRDYGLNYKSAYSSCSEDTEPTLKKLAEMTEEITQNNIKVILCQELSNNKVAKALSDATGAKLLTLHSCHNVSKDDFNSGITYIDLMNQNISVLTEALN